MCYAPKLDANQEILMNWGYRKALSFGKPFSTESNGEGEGPLIPAYVLKSDVGLSTGGCWFYDFDCWVCSLCEIVRDELIDSGSEAFYATQYVLLRLKLLEVVLKILLPTLLRLLVS